MKKLKLKIILLGIGIFSCFTPVFAMQNNNNEQKKLEMSLEDDIKSNFYKKEPNLRLIFINHGLISSNDNIDFLENNGEIKQYRSYDFFENNIQNQVIDNLKKGKKTIKIPLENIIVHSDLKKREKNKRNYIKPYILKNKIKLTIYYIDGKFSFQMSPDRRNLKCKKIIVDEEKTEKIQENETYYNETINKNLDKNLNKETQSKSYEIKKKINEELQKKQITNLNSNNLPEYFTLELIRENNYKKIQIPFEEIVLSKNYKDFRFHDKIKDVLENNQSNLNPPNESIVSKTKEQNSYPAFELIEFNMFEIKFKITYEKNPFEKEFDFEEKKPNVFDTKFDFEEKNPNVFDTKFDFEEKNPNVFDTNLIFKDNTNNDFLNFNPENKLEINKNSEPLNLENEFLNKKRSPENFELNNLPETKKDDDFKK